MTARAAEVGDGSVGATRSYLCPARDQLFLMPVSMRDWLDEGHLAFFVLDVVGEMDTGVLHRRPGGCSGRRPYEPEMMLAVLLYAYCCGIRSSRRIEEHCQTDAAFRVICGGLVPDHATIARFVVEHERALEGLFVEGVRLCAAAGLADLSVVALDGTKIAADASLARNRDGDWVRREIAKLMALTAEDQPLAGADTDGLAGLEPACEISTPTGRLARLQAALAVIKAEDAAVAEAALRQTQAAAALAEHGRQQIGRKPKQPNAALARAEVDHAVARKRLEDLQAERERRAAAAARGEQTTGPRLRIDKAQATLELAEARLAAAHQALQTAPEPDRRVNVTDPDSRIMSTKDGWVQGYNAQAIVNPHQIVLAVDVSQDPTDVALFQPMNQKLTHTLAAAGITTEPELELADAGYCSEHNLTCPGPDRLIATTKDWKQRRAARELGHTDGPPPPGLTATEEMEHLLRTPQGHTAYKQRSQLIEPVFGDRKHNRHIRRFRRRGLTAARSEWAFIHLTGNILKLYQHHSTVTIA
ncbi:MAG TPA: transposase [Solirubrobacteraceae bacterium]|nr:transposase [Solirubrobacteraceae bacterium]